MREYCRHTVDAAENSSAGECRNKGRELREVAAHIGGAGDAQRKDVAILVERQFGLGSHIAAMIVAEEGFRAGANPARGAAELFRRDQHQRLLGIHEALHAEAAADVLGNDAHLVLGQIQDPCDAVA